MKTLKRKKKEEEKSWMMENKYSVHWNQKKIHSMSRLKHLSGSTVEGQEVEREMTTSLGED